MTKDISLKVVNEIEQVVCNYTIGWANEEAIKKINILLNKIRNPLWSDKISFIREYTKILFSARKHEKYGGAKKVRSLILNSCTSIEDLILRQDKESFIK